VCIRHNQKGGNIKPCRQFESVVLQKRDRRWLQFQYLLANPHGHRHLQPRLEIHQLHLHDPVYHLLVLVHRVPIRSILPERNLPRDHQHQQIATQLNQHMYLTL
jgi:hypothetical protein